nr:PREDICTED: glucagon [Anolis carolinensis]|eukprot:XP_008117191.1 PREDICTED: glucagon [Anolis carolinensis]
MTNMKSMYFVAGLVLMIVQSSWQSPLQETEEKSRSFKASQAEPLDDSRQLNEVKRHSQGTFTSDYSKYLDTRRAQDFVQWLMNTKRSGFVEGAGAAEDVGRRHADGTFTSDYNKLLDDMATQEFLKWLISQKVTQRDLVGEYQ